MRTTLNETTPLYCEEYRPQFHFTARSNWLNDPNGLVYYDGEYHMFFQHNPTGINWGNMHWGHAVSTDLIHWEELPIALSPDRLGTIFSGSGVVDWNNTTGFQTGSNPPIVLIYTAAGGDSPESEGQPYTQCIAYSNDRGRTWSKYEANPVLPHVVGQNRDPKVIWYEQRSCWIMCLYLDGEEFALFSSPNLKHWTRLQTIHLAGAGECPDFFPLTVEGDSNEKYWVFSAANGRYLVGEFNGREFKAKEGPFHMELGANFYAVQTYSDIPESDGRRIQIAWMAGGIYPGMPFNQQISIPSALTLRRLPEGLRLCRYPVREIEKLRKKAYHWSNLTLHAADHLLSTITGDLFEIELEVEEQASGEWGMRVRGAEISCSFDKRTISCLGRTTPCPTRDGKLQLCILVDRTSIEIFANGGQTALASCFTPASTDVGLQMLVGSTTVNILTLDVYELSSMWGCGVAA